MWSKLDMSSAFTPDSKCRFELFIWNVEYPLWEWCSRVLDASEAVWALRFVKCMHMEEERLSFY